MGGANRINESMAELVCQEGFAAGRRFPLDRPRTVLGRHPDCDVVIDLGAVSRQHAAVDREGGAYFVVDLKSRNGTFVNGAPIRERKRLASGDAIRICESLLTFNDPLQVATETASLIGSRLGKFLKASNEQGDSSTILSKLELNTGSTGMRLTVNPQVKLQALFEISQSLSRALSIDEVLPKIMESLFKVFLQADRGFVALRESEGAPLLLRAMKHRRNDLEDTLRMSRTIVDRVIGSREAILSADAANDTRFDMSQSVADFRIRSMMCAPVLDSEGRAIGVIQIDTLDQRSKFQPEDLDVLASVASLAGVAIENAQLHEQSLKQKTVERDLELAHEVQRGLLPVHPPLVTGFEFFDFYEAANQVGGDYFDYIPMPDGRWAVVLADVAGKGVAAALLMAKLSGEVRYCLASEPSAVNAMTRLNKVFIASNWGDRFVTFVLCIVDPKQNELRLVNAGHMPPLFRGAEGKVQELGAADSGIALGVVDDYTYRETIVRLSPGDRVLVYTDGISEAMDPGGNLYTIGRLRDRFGAMAGGVSAVGRGILEDVKRFAGGRSQSDDMCLTCFGRVG